jgi:hypothetical protein
MVFHLRNMVLADTRHFGKLFLCNAVFYPRAFQTNAGQLFIRQLWKCLTPRQRIRRFHKSKLIERGNRFFPVSNRPVNAILIGRFFMGSNIGDLHYVYLFIDNLPYGNVGRFAFFQVAVVTVDSQLAVIGPVASYRAAFLDLPYKGNQAGFHVCR